MYTRIFKDNNENEWLRVDKRNARRRYEAGETLIICADNLPPVGAYSFGVAINKNSFRNFDAVTKEYTLLNCYNIETGYRPAYYRRLSVEESVNSLY